MSTPPDATDPSNEETAVPGAVAEKPVDPPGDPAPDPREEELKRIREQLLRTAADFDNYRKRSRREVEDAQRRGGEDLLRELLPVFDNLERAVTSSAGATEIKPVVDGVRMVLKQFMDTLSRANIRRVPSVGQPFDPALHEAIQQMETADHPAGTIVAEVQPGYALGEKLIRAAMVVVAKPPANKPAAAPEAKGDDVVVGDLDPAPPGTDDTKSN